MFPPMDLEEFRISVGETYLKLAARWGSSSASQARRYAQGEQWPREDRLEEILRTCPGVDMHAMHKRRMAWCRANRHAPF